MIKDEIQLEKILNEVEMQMRENNLEGFKAVIKSLDQGAMKVLNETEGGITSEKMKERLQLLRHYLDYMKRFCNSKV